VAGGAQHRLEPAVGLVGLGRLLEPFRQHEADAGERGPSGEPGRAESAERGTDRPEPAGEALHGATHLAGGTVQRGERARARPGGGLDPPERPVAGLADIPQLGLDLAAIDHGETDGKRAVGHSCLRLASANAMH
jgi:hypothetical protein